MGVYAINLNRLLFCSELETPSFGPDNSGVLLAVKYQDPILDMDVRKEDAQTWLEERLSQDPFVLLTYVDGLTVSKKDCSISPPALNYLGLLVHIWKQVHQSLEPRRVHLFASGRGQGHVSRRKLLQIEVQM